MTTYTVRTIHGLPWLLPGPDVAGAYLPATSPTASADAVGHHEQPALRGGSAGQVEITGG